MEQNCDSNNSRKEDVKNKRKTDLKHNKFGQQKGHHTARTKKYYKDTKKLQTALVQPSTSFADFEDAEPLHDVGKDFQSLMKCPISEGGHFVFKSEKYWIEDISENFKYFTLDLKLLSAAINSIPFHDYMDIEEKYFTVDQLTSIYNAAEIGKNIYKEIQLGSLAPETMKINNTEQPTGSEENIIVEGTKELNLSKADSISNNSDTEEDLDFLLCLKEPVKRTPISVAVPAHTVQTEALKIESTGTASKPIDLENWLDSVLED